MADRIFKYSFGLADDKIKMPVAAQILTADKQAGGYYIWAMIDDTAPMEWREIRVIGTGHPIDAMPKYLKYINSIFDGPFVWHVFEVRINV